MPPNSNRLVASAFALAAAVLCTNVARADETTNTTSSSGMGTVYAGVQGLAIVGEHQDVAGTQHGVGAGPLLQIRGGGRRLALGVEGIPVVSVPEGASAHYGQATPKLGIINGALEYAIDPQAHIWVGIGATVYNQRTPLPNLQQEVSSRLAGIRYMIRYRQPLNAAHFVEAVVGGAPTLWGIDHYIYTDPTIAPVNRDERASEIDASVSFGVRHGSSEWLFGIRTVNFSAHFTATGEAADRNVGTGPLVEWRHQFRH
jgi:hypothetical protein